MTKADKEDILPLSEDSATILSVYGGATTWFPTGGSTRARGVVADRERVNWGRVVVIVMCFRHTDDVWQRVGVESRYNRIRFTINVNEA
jgi:hypothetical protein